MRDDVLLGLVDMAMTDKQFRQLARTDLEGALRTSGYELTAEELSAVREFNATVAGLSDSDLERLLSHDTHRQFAG